MGTVGSGQWAVGSGQWTDCEPRTVRRDEALMGGEFEVADDTVVQSSAVQAVGEDKDLEREAITLSCRSIRAERGIGWSGETAR